MWSFIRFCMFLQSTYNLACTQVTQMPMYKVSRLEIIINFVKVCDSSIMFIYNLASRCKFVMCKMYYKVEFVKLCITKALSYWKFKMKYSQINRLKLFVVKGRYRKFSAFWDYIFQNWNYLPDQNMKRLFMLVLYVFSFLWYFSHKF